MIILLIWNGILAMLSFPPVFKSLFKLEIIDDRWVDYSRWIIWLLISTMLVALLVGSIPHGMPAYIGYIIILSAVSLEIISRALIKYGERIVPKKQSLLNHIKTKLTEYSMYGIFSPRFEAHPFLHFTLKRRALEDGNAEMGFANITLKDIPKPSGTIRVACMGNSTAAHYPQHLQEFLNAEGTQTRFQVLNFGMGWWSSVHSTVNFILNIIDFKPDYVVMNDNCNDHNYRGYRGLRGDCVHAYRPIAVPPSQDIYWSRLSVLYRILALVIKRKYPTAFIRRYSAEKSILLPGKEYQYDPAELDIFERNLETVYAVSAHRNIRLCLMTHPYSNILKYGEEHDKVYRPHMAKVNDMLREKAIKYGLPLIDADQLITGEEGLFRDPVHVTTKGEMIKAYMIGGCLLKDMNLPIQAHGEWKEIENWILDKAAKMKSDPVTNIYRAVS